MTQRPSHRFCFVVYFVTLIPMTTRPTRSMTPHPSHIVPESLLTPSPSLPSVKPPILTLYLPVSKRSSINIEQSSTQLDNLPKPSQHNLTVHSTMSGKPPTKPQPSPCPQPNPNPRPPPRSRCSSARLGHPVSENKPPQPKRHSDSTIYSIMFPGTTCKMSPKPKPKPPPPSPKRHFNLAI
jgi:hypothetical protein